jgi:hypothetical protein
MGEVSKQKVIGTCSLCGGRVVKRCACEDGRAECESCGAHEAVHGPVIPMVQPRCTGPVYIPYIPYIPYITAPAPLLPPWTVTCEAGTVAASTPGMLVDVTSTAGSSAVWTT